MVILLATYNGEKYLKDQLNSLFSQRNCKIKIIARDDGSTDTTLDILKSFDVLLMPSYKNIGTKESFSLLLEYALECTESDYFMFCDQDDVWKSDKVEKTLKRMQELEILHKESPLLVHTDLEVVDENMKRINSSFVQYQNLNAKKNSFTQLLLQNTMTGCTIMINRSLASLALPIAQEAIMHDWWIGLVASKFGKIGYIDTTTIKYRQHVNNSIGAKGFTLFYIIKRLQNSESISQNTLQTKAFLQRYKNDLDAKSVAMLEDFISIESQSFWKKRKILFKHKLLKQGLLRNLGLMLKI